MHCSVQQTTADSCDSCPISSGEACTADLGLFGAAKQACKWILRGAVLLFVFFFFVLLLLTPKQLPKTASLHHMLCHQTTPAGVLLRLPA